MGGLRSCGPRVTPGFLRPQAEMGDRRDQSSLDPERRLDRCRLRRIGPDPWGGRFAAASSRENPDLDPGPPPTDGGARALASPRRRGAAGCRSRRCHRRRRRGLELPGRIGNGREGAGGALTAIHPAPSRCWGVSQRRTVVGPLPMIKYSSFKAWIDGSAALEALKAMEVHLSELPPKRQVQVLRSRRRPLSVRRQPVCRCRPCASALSGGDRRVGQHPLASAWCLRPP